jgi:hypothetical protein
MTNTLTLKLRVVLLLTISFVFVSCGGQKPMVTDINVKPGYQDNDVVLGLFADLSLGNVQLPAVQIPVYMPRSWEEIGNVSMTPVASGKNQLSVAINLSAIAQIEAQRASLPNGSTLPLIGDNKTIVIPVDNKLTIYVSFGDGVAALGVSIPFKTLDGMGAKVGTTALMPVFNIKGVFGAAGIYTSKSKGKNGFALFADLSQVLDPIHFIDLGSPVSTLKSINYRSYSPSSSKKKRIDKELYKMHKRRKKLRLH